MVFPDPSGCHYFGFVAETLREGVIVLHPQVKLIDTLHALIIFHLQLGIRSYCNKFIQCLFTILQEPGKNPPDIAEFCFGKSIAIAKLSVGLPVILYNAYLKGNDVCYLCIVSENHYAGQIPLW